MPARPSSESSDTGAVLPATVTGKLSGILNRLGEHGSVKRNVMSATKTSVYESAAPKAYRSSKKLIASSPCRYAATSSTNATPAKIRMVTTGVFVLRLICWNSDGSN